jgi:chromosome segregation ATPase
VLTTPVCASAGDELKTVSAQLDSAVQEKAALQQQIASLKETAQRGLLQLKAKNTQLAEEKQALERELAQAKVASAEKSAPSPHPAESELGLLRQQVLSLKTELEAAKTGASVAAQPSANHEALVRERDAAVAELNTLKSKLKDQLGRLRGEMERLRAERDALAETNKHLDVQSSSAELTKLREALDQAQREKGAAEAMLLKTQGRMQDEMEMLQARAESMRQACTELDKQVGECPPHVAYCDPV